jgi:hypothetical protein
MSIISNDKGLLTAENRNEPGNRLKQKQPAPPSSPPSGPSFRTGRATSYRAWVAKGAKEPMGPETVVLGPVGAEDVEVAVEHCGLCHSDLSVLNPARPATASSWKPIIDPIAHSTSPAAG